MRTLAPEEQDFLAELSYKSTHEGGRMTAARTGIRPHVKFPFSKNLTSGQQTFLEKEWVNRGEFVTAYIKIVSVEVFKNLLEEGMEFEFSEGSRVTGKGKILRVINPRLRKQA